MIIDPIEMQDIRYNPASACYEAKVTVHGAGPACVYACEFQGCLSLDDAAISDALRSEALRRHAGRYGLRSHHHTTEPRPRHGTRRAATRDTNWFARLPSVVGLKAA